MEYTITSKENKLIKHIKSLQQKKYRDSCGQFFIEGIKMVDEALKQDCTQNIVICPDLLEKTAGGGEFLEIIKEFKVELSAVPANIFKEISDTDTPQGILAVIGKQDVYPEGAEWLTAENGLYVLLDGVQDPGNVGTIIRTADAAGADGVVLSKGCADIYSPKTLRSTMGSIFRVRLYEKADLCKTAEDIQNAGGRIIGTAPDVGLVYSEADYSGITGIIIGSESNGIRPELLELADCTVRIPMKGGAESLNASVAAGILIYEAVKCRSGSL